MASEDWALIDLNRLRKVSGQISRVRDFVDHGRPADAKDEIQRVTRELRSIREDAAHYLPGEDGPDE